MGACNKNGTYYALAANPLSTNPLWSDAVGAPAGSLSMCIASSVWNGTTSSLYLAGDATTIASTSYGGSIGQVDPATGSYTWHTGLPCAVMGTPSLNASGITAAVTYTGWITPGTPALYMLDATNGASLDSISLGGSKLFGSPYTPGPTSTSPANQGVSILSRRNRISSWSGSPL